MKATVAVFFVSFLFASSAFASDDLLDTLEDAIESDVEQTNGSIDAAIPANDLPKRAVAEHQVEDASWSRVWE